MFELTLHQGAELVEVLDELARLGIFPQPDEIVSNGEMTVILARSAPESLPSLARDSRRQVDRRESLPAPLGDRLRRRPSCRCCCRTTASFTTNTSMGWKLWNAGIDGNASGTAQIVTMMDTGLNTNMEHFSESTTSNGALGAGHRKVVGYDVYGGDECVNSNFTPRTAVTAPGPPSTPWARSRT